MQVDGLLLEPPDGDMGVHLLEVAPDHHGGVILAVQASDGQGAGDGNADLFKSQVAHLLGGLSSAVRQVGRKR